MAFPNQGKEKVFFSLSLTTFFLRGRKKKLKWQVGVFQSFCQWLWKDKNNFEFSFVQYVLANVKYFFPWQLQLKHEQACISICNKIWLNLTLHVINFVLSCTQWTVKDISKIWIFFFNLEILLEQHLKLCAEESWGDRTLHLNASRFWIKDSTNIMEWKYGCSD